VSGVREEKQESLSLNTETCMRLETLGFGA
jgi:hypothetical protein